MKKTTKLLSIVLAVVIALSCFAVLAFAADEHTHSYTATVVQPTCADKGYTIHVCSDCGDYYKDSYVNPFGHSWGAWTDKEEATCTKEGLKERTCSVCGAVETKTVSVTDHVDANRDNKCDYCGTDVSVETPYVQNPYDWFRALWRFIVEWFRGIFA